MVRGQDMFRNERLQLIVEQLLREKKVVVQDLADKFQVSPSTIRIDLSELESRGLLTRTYGGAILPEGLSGHMITESSPIYLREQIFQPEKEAIGKAAAELIEDGDTVMIDCGSTTAHVAPFLKEKRHISVVSNSGRLIALLLNYPNVKLFIPGGLYDRQREMLMGEMTVEGFGRYRTKKAIIGADGLSIQSGLTVTDPEMAAIKSAIIAASEMLIVVCDHSKLDKVCLMPVIPLRQVDVLVTDADADPDFVDQIREAGTRVIVAEPTS